MLSDIFRLLQRRPQLKKGRPSRPLSVLSVTYNILGVHLHTEAELAGLVALAKQGHIVTSIVATDRKRCPNTDVSGFNLETILMRRNSPVVSVFYFIVVTFWRTLQLMDKYDVIIVDYNTIFLLFPVFMVRRVICSSPLLFLRINSEPVETGGVLRSLAVSFSYALSIKLAEVVFDKIFFISSMQAEVDGARFRIRKSKVSVWPSVVNMNLFDSSSVNGQSVERLRTQLRLRGRIAILHHGRLSEARGILETVQAFKLLRNRRVKLVLVGDGPAKRKLEEYIQMNQLWNTVVLAGPVPHHEIPPYISACDVEIVPLPNHPWWRFQTPTKVLECLAMNKPLIVSDIPSNRRIIGNAPVAVYMNGTTPEEIEDSVLRFLKYKTKLTPSLGRKLIHNFSAEYVGEMLHRQITSLLT
jgi:glycosyltransferase involved in cell wall biosynthesis